MSNYVVLKLVSGQDVIGKKIASDATADDMVITLENPLTMLTTTIDNGATIVFLRSFALLSKSKRVPIAISQIVSQYEPLKVMIDYYNIMIEYNKKFIEEDMIKGMKTANFAIKQVIDREADSIMPKSLSDKDKKSIEYWESLMKSDSKKH